MFQDRIRECYEHLTPGFRKIADYIVGNPLEAAFLNATKLAQRADVNPATLTRFIQELGYADFPELSGDIKQYVRDEVTKNHRWTEEVITEEVLLHTLEEEVQRNLQTLTVTAPLVLAETVKRLQQACHVWVTGEFLSYDLASFLAKILTLIDIPATAFRPGMTETPHTLSQMKEEDILLAITVTPPSLDTGYAVQLAREKGLTTICLTNLETVSPAQEANITITTLTNSQMGFANVSVALMTIGLIWEALASQKGPEIGAVFIEQYDNLSQILELRAKIRPFDLGFSSERESD